MGELKKRLELLLKNMLSAQIGQGEFLNATIAIFFVNWPTKSNQHMHKIQGEPKS